MTSSPNFSSSCLFNNILLLYILVPSGKTISYFPHARTIILSILLFIFIYIYIQTTTTKKRNINIYLYIEISNIRRGCSSSSSLLHNNNKTRYIHMVWYDFWFWWVFEIRDFMPALSPALIVLWQMPHASRSKALAVYSNIYLILVEYWLQYYYLSTLPAMYVWSSEIWEKKRGKTSPFYSKISPSPVPEMGMYICGPPCTPDPSSSSTRLPLCSTPFPYPHWQQTAFYAYYSRMRTITISRFFALLVAVTGTYGFSVPPLSYPRLELHTISLPLQESSDQYKVGKALGINTSCLCQGETQYIVGCP